MNMANHSFALFNTTLHGNTTTTGRTPNTGGFRNVSQTSDLPGLIFGVLLLFFCFIVCLISIIHLKSFPLERASLDAQSAKKDRLEKRRVFIEENLTVREWNTHDFTDIKNEEQNEDDEATEDDFTATASPEADEQIRVDNDVPSCVLSRNYASFCDDAGCAVCLCNYKAGDRVCESSSSCCKHIFHEACMASWLLKRDECPLCRQKYIVVSV
jgi:Ring finger domain